MRSAQNSGPLKTQVFIKTQGILTKTQGISTQIGVILATISWSLTKIGRILPEFTEKSLKNSGWNDKNSGFRKSYTYAKLGKVHKKNKPVFSKPT